MPRLVLDKQHRLLVMEGSYLFKTMTATAAPSIRQIVAARKMHKARRHRAKKPNGRRDCRRALSRSLKAEPWPSSIGVSSIVPFGFSFGSCAPASDLCCASSDMSLFVDTELLREETL
jgi:hypothetical protein